jgi:cytochrome c oxidase subunit 7c
MLARVGLRALPSTSTSLVARRGFHATRTQLSSPYHYPEGPYTNIPFNPKGRFFALKFWTFCGVGFGMPFGIAGKSSLSGCGVDWKSTVLTFSSMEYIQTEIVKMLALYGFAP